MSFRVVRSSKFRHVFGNALKRDQCYDNIRITKSSWDSAYCAVNPKFLAIVTEAAGGGAFLVLPLEKTGRIERDTPLVIGHKAAVLDIAWCPHDDNYIASTSEDCTVKIWKIPDGGLVRNLEDAEVELCYHQKRATNVAWHPTAENIVLSAGSDCLILLWNLETAEIICEIEIPEIPFSISWNYDGSRFLVTCKDKKIRVIDPRKGEGEIIKESFGHEGSKPQQAVYLKDGRIFTTGFSRMSERQYGLWDADLHNMVIQEIDNSNGVQFPMYDPDASLVFLCGKGDSVIRYYEITDESPYVHWLSNFQSGDPQRGIGMMTKRGVNVNNNEIARFYRLLAKGFVEVVPMVVPRKSELFQDDLYPDTAAEEPALSADAWINGENADPPLQSMKEHFKTSEKTSKNKTISQKSKIKGKVPSKMNPSPKVEPTVPVPAPTVVSPPVVTTTPSTNESKPITNNVSAAPKETNAEPSPAPIVPPGIDFQNILDDIRKLKIIVKGHERRIKQLEEEKRALIENQNDSTI